MNKSRYYDSAAVIQVIGCTILDPSLLDDDGKYFYNMEDFTLDFHKVVFGSIYNLHQMGTQKITCQDIENYLSKRPESKGIYESNHGSAWIQEVVNNAEIGNFDYYYDRVKKMTLLRSYESCGLDMRFLYDPDELFDNKKKKNQEDYLDSLSLNEIADIIDNKIFSIRAKVIDNATDESVDIGNNIFELLEDLRKTPDMGSPLYGKYMNTITRGARLGKFFLRSAGTGVGKTRSMIADACFIACDKIFNEGEWKSNGIKEPVLYISTELEMDEVQTMALAFLSNVNEDHILNAKYEFGEYERIMEAAKILSESPLYIECMPDFSLKDIENCIKRNIRTKNCQHIFFDYINTSMKILEEITRRSAGMKLREDNILFLLSTRLKDICTQFNVFILSSTQLNGNFKSEDYPDQTLLRGAKSIADRVDWGSIMLDVVPEDEEKIQNIVAELGCEMPNIKLSIYKNRRGKYTKCFLWMYADKGTCRYNGLFATNYKYEVMPIKDTEIIVGVV